MTDEHPFNQQADADGFDQERENQILAQIEAERTATPGSPTSLFLLMLAPLLLIAFALLLVWFLRPAPAPAPNTGAEPLAATTLSPTAPSTSDATAIGWQTSFNEALALSQKTGKPIMADFYADWCGPCKMLDEQTWVDPSVIAEAQNVIAVKVDVDADTATARRYNIGPIPSIIWMDSAGNEKGRSVGFSGPQEMLSLMQQYR